MRTITAAITGTTTPTTTGTTTTTTSTRTSTRIRAGTATHSHPHGHGHSHTHELPERITGRTLVAAGAAAGLIPCPSALVVLLAAVSQHQVGLGLLLIVAFSLGLAATLTAIGLAVVSAGRITQRIDITGRFVAALPAVSAVVICGVGCLLTLQALGEFV
jgi:nickel/cobalt transporter (NicO) family protein